MALTEEQLADIRSRIPARPETDIPMPYEDLVRKILTEGTLKSDRTGTGTISLFGQQMRFDLSKYFPLLTTKTVFFKGLAYELLWFLKGSSNINWLLEHNVHIWDEWADENGDRSRPCRRRRKRRPTCRGSSCTCHHPSASGWPSVRPRRSWNRPS